MDYSQYFNKNILPDDIKEYVIPDYSSLSNKSIKPTSKQPKACSMRGIPGKNRLQTQLVIQGSVRIPHSLYVMNVKALNAYEHPLNNYTPINTNGSLYIAPPHVNWNQMSDRRMPHIQVATTASGSTYRPSSTKHTIMRMRPGALSPGGIGVDIKHNSYERYLNRLKGKGPIRAGPYGAIELPVVYNRSNPIYGDKVIKTGIVNGCSC